LNIWIFELLVAAFCFSSLPTACLPFEPLNFWTFDFYFSWSTFFLPTANCQLLTA
jgi:hypothetical protein